MQPEIFSGSIVKELFFRVVQYSPLFLTQEYRLSERTYSLWGHLTNTADEFVNPLYDHSRYGTVVRALAILVIISAFNFNVTGS